MGSGAYFFPRGVKLTTYPSIAKVNNMWSYASTPHTSSLNSAYLITNMETSFKIGNNSKEEHTNL
jgi:hypothetical protein